MIGLVGIVALLIVLGLSLVITRLASVALQITGISREAARFQARSAFTGTGFTTQEAESVVNHPVRRRIIMLLMILRSAGLITIVISLILSFATTGTEEGRLLRLGCLLIGVLVLWALANSKFVDRHMCVALQWALNRWTDLDARDYASLLNLSGEYGVLEVEVREREWLANKTLRTLKLNEEGIVVLGITRTDGEYVGVPKADTRIYAGDKLILYGRTPSLHELDRRRADTSGDEAHKHAIAEQRERMIEQDIQEEKRQQQRQTRG